MTQKLAVLCARHPWRTIVAWIGAIVVAVVLVGGLLGDGLTSDGYVTNDPESLRGYDLLAERFPDREGFDELVVVRSESYSVGDEPFRAKVAERRARRCSRAGRPTTCCVRHRRPQSRPRPTATPR